MRIPINDLKQLAKKRQLTHIIVFAFDGERQHIATYGKTLEGCGQAADLGNKLKKFLGWPRSLYAQPSRVRRMKNYIKELEQKIKEMKNNCPPLAEVAHSAGGGKDENNI